MNTGRKEMDDSQREIEEYVKENKQFLVRMLAYGDAETRSYALAVVANGGSINDISAIQRELDQLKRSRRK